MNESILDGESKYYDVWHWIPIALMLFEVSCCFKEERAVTFAVEITKAWQQESVKVLSGTVICNQHSASFFLMFTQIRKHC